MTDKLSSTTIDGMIQASVEVFPEAVALLAPQRIPCSYQTLHTHLKQIGSDLQALGIGSRDCVVVSLPNGPEMASVFLGVARVAMCAPLNPGYREAECDFYLSDLSPKVLIVQAGRDPAQDPVQRVAKQKGIPILELHSEPEYPAGQFDLLGSIPNPEQSSRLSGSEDIALILHTSGTTSRPKMVPLTHYNLCLSAQNIAHTLKLTPEDRCLNIMPLFHIHGLVACLLSSLQVGSSVICTSGFQGDQILSWIQEYQPTWYSAVPTMHQIILSQVQTHGNPGHSLRFLRSSSSTMPARILGEIEATFGIPLIEAYSMTEASHQMTTNPLPPDPRKLRSVGIPGQTQVAIADPDQNRLLAQGELGEVVIQGRSVTKGYLNNPEANAKSFFEGWFRTGDQGYLDQDGYLFLQGRLKEIVNRGGEKVSPIEVDEALMDFPEVYQAVTFAVPHPTLGEDVAVAIVLNPGIQVTPEALRIRLFSLLADFKVPSQIIFVESIPKGATGKLSRMGLADKLASSLKTTFVPPQTEIEKGIAGIIHDVLQCEPVGILDNFFALGGDSLKGTQVTSRINDRYRLSLRNTILFRYPTIQELAPEIEKLTAEDPVLADLIIEFQTLSPEEIDHLLAEVENQ